MPTGPVVASTPVAPNPYQGRPIGPAYASIPSAVSARPDLTFASTMPVVTSAPPSYVMAPGEVPPPQSKLILRACIPLSKLIFRACITFLLYTCRKYTVFCPL